MVAGRSTTCTIVVLLLAASAVSAAPEPTLSDIAGCNGQAAKATGASAMPHPGTPAPEPHRDPSTSRRPDATPPDVEPGPVVPGDRLPPGASTPVPRPGAPGERTDPSGSVITETPDPLLKGMDASRVDDPHYRAAYRDCMRARLGRR